MAVGSSAPASPRIFISYRRADSEQAASRLANDLRRHFRSEQVFQDFASIDPGADFLDAVQQGLDSGAAVLVVIGPRWLAATDAQGRRRLDLADDWVRHEVSESLRRSGVRVFPLLVDGAEMPKVEDLPEAMQPLTRRQAFPLTVRHWEKDLAELIEHLRRVPGLEHRPRLGPAWPALAGAIAGSVLLAAAVVFFWSGDAPPKPPSVAVPPGAAAEELARLAEQAGSLLAAVGQQRRDLAMTAQAARGELEQARAKLAAASSDDQRRSRQVAVFEAQERQDVADQVLALYSKAADGAQGAAALAAQIDEAARAASAGKSSLARAQYAAVIEALGRLQGVPETLQRQVAAQRDDWLQALAGRWAEDDCASAASFTVSGRKLHVSWPPHGDADERVLSLAPAEVVTVVTTAGRYQGRLSRYLREDGNLTISSVGSERSVRLRRCG